MLFADRISNWYFAKYYSKIEFPDESPYISVSY